MASASGIWDQGVAYLQGVIDGVSALPPHEQFAWLFGPPVVLIGFVWFLIRRGSGRKRDSGARPLTKGAIGKLPKAPKRAEGMPAFLVFDLDGDGARTERTDGVFRSLYEAFDGHAHVQRAPGVIVRIAPGGDFKANFEDARALVDKALHARGWDGAVWGDVVVDKDLVHLTVQTKDAAGGAQKDHLLDERLRLPLDAVFGLGAVIAARLAEAAAPAYEGGRYVADVLRPVADRLRALLAAPPGWLAGDALGRARHDLGTALSRIGEQAGDNVALEEAVRACRAALEERTRERAPLDWATTQNDLGNALLRLGERESGTARLEEAVAAYRAALEEYTRERAPLDWAMTQNNLGTALQRLGERESGTARLADAVAAYRAALEERTRERVPLKWAGTQNNLGLALQRLGERESGTARLEEAVAAYRAALLEYTRERAPLYWATTQNNLGNALQEIGARESGPKKARERLEEAVAAYRSALQEFTRERVPLQWAYSTYAWALAEIALGDKTSGAEARAHYRAAEEKILAALEEFRRGDAYWAEQAEAPLAYVRGKLAG